MHFTLTTLRLFIVLSMFVFLNEILSQEEHQIKEISKFEQNVSDHENQKNCENLRNSNHG